MLKSYNIQFKKTSFSHRMQVYFFLNLCFTISLFSAYLASRGKVFIQNFLLPFIYDYPFLHFFSEERSLKTKPLSWKTLFLFLTTQKGDARRGKGRGRDKGLPPLLLLSPLNSLEVRSPGQVYKAWLYPLPTADI